MTDFKEQPVMQPYPDKLGTGWHVVIRYPKEPEREITGFSTEEEALDWIIANADELDE